MPFVRFDLGDPCPFSLGDLGLSLAVQASSAMGHKVCLVGLVGLVFVKPMELVLRGMAFGEDGVVGPCMLYVVVLL